MPVSWEMASGPSVAYNVARQGSSCVAVEGPKGSNFSNFRVQDAMSRGFYNSGEVPKGSNYRIASSNDTVIRGLSALSLRGQYQLDADSTAEESRCGSLGALCCASSEFNRCMSPRNDESLPFTLAPPSVCNKPLGQGSPVCNVDFVPGMRSQALSDEMGSGNSEQFLVSPRIDLSMAYHTSAVQNGHSYGDKDLRQNEAHSFYNALQRASMQESTHRDGGCDLDTISEASYSSESCMPEASYFSGEALHVSDDAEAQSAYKDTGDFTCSMESSLAPRKGLSQFYAGKSRSFSCLRDVTSIKDLAKPESPYVKKRKVASSNSRLPPLQKGSASISKKPPQSGKSTLALAVAMSTKEENESQFSYVSPMTLKSLRPARSYSLSDLQGAGGSLFFIS